MSKLGTRIAAVGALALGLSLGGSSAYADLTLQLSEAVQGGGTEVLNIDSSTGVATLTGAPIGTYTYSIDGQAVTFIVTDPNAVTTGTPFAPNNAQVSFSAIGTTSMIVPFATDQFGDYSVTTITASQSEGNNKAHIFDVSTDVGGTANNGSGGNSANSPLTITPGYESFTMPVGPVVLQSVFSPTSLDSGQVTFSSTLPAPSSGTTPTLTETAAEFAANPGMGMSNSVIGDTVLSQLEPSPAAPSYLAENQIVISGLASGDTDSFSATTNISPTPEPATMALAFSALPILGIAALRRRRKATA